MSFHFRRHSAETKRALFRNNGGLAPAAKFKLEPATCSFCSMKSVTRCELPSCDLPLCERHRTRKSGGNLCPKHRGAVIVQYDGMPCTRFGDKGEAVPHVEKIRSRA